MQGKWVQFRTMIFALARLIEGTVNHPQRLPPGAPVANLMDIANAFDEQQPFDVKILPLTPAGDGWRPSAVDFTVEEATFRTAEKQLVFIRKIDAGHDLAARLEQAKAEKQVLLVIADAAQSIGADLLHSVLRFRLLP